MSAPGGGSTRASISCSRWPRSCFAINGRDGLAAAALALAVMTKPQALPFLVPFAAWFWARGGLRGFLTATAIGIAVVVLVWLPSSRPGARRTTSAISAEYQNGIFSLLSVNAWNVWWILQVIAAGGKFASDTTAVFGPDHFRHIGFLLTGLLEAGRRRRRLAGPTAADADPRSGGLDIDLPSAS